MEERMDKHSLKARDDAFGDAMDEIQSVPLGQPSRDPWRHRSEHMTCRSCMAYAPKTDNLGRCRQNAPTMKGFPVVYPDEDWCMQHRLNEVYIEHQRGGEKEKIEGGFPINTIDR